MSKSAEHELEHGSATAKCCTHRWATNRKAPKKSHAHFCPAFNDNVFIGCHKLLRNFKDLLVKKMELCNNFLEEQEDGINRKAYCKITSA